MRRTVLGVGLVVAVVATAVWGVPAGFAGEDRFGQEDIEAELRLSIELELSNESTHLVCEHGDEQDLEGAETPARGNRVAFAWEAEWKDRERTCLGTKAERFNREYERLVQHVDWDAQDRGSGHFSCSSPIAGTEHTWEWRESAYRRSVQAGADLEPEVLTSLGSDLSCSWLFPGDSVPAQGEQWRLGARQMINGMWPGGFDREFTDWGRSASVHIALVPGIPAGSLFWSEAVDGWVVAKRHPGTDAHTATIVLLFDVLVAISATEWTDRALAGDVRIDDRYIQMMNYGGKGLEWAIKGEATIQWSIEDRHFISVDLKADVEVHSNLSWSYKWDAPLIEEFLGERSEEWRGQLILSGTAVRTQ